MEAALHGFGVKLRVAQLPKKRHWQLVLPVVQQPAVKGEAQVQPISPANPDELIEQEGRRANRNDRTVRIIFEDKSNAANGNEYFLGTSEFMDNGMRASGSFTEPTSKLGEFSGRCKLTADGRLRRCIGGVCGSAGFPEDTST